jgi:bifunctional DNA-binding transcriptional regulator/antitoxin component of YhaV-PrlF toxin-antitoxin module
MAERIKIAADGSIKLPPELRKKLGWISGCYLEFAVDGERVAFRKVEVDVFAEAAKKPDEDSFKKALKKQKESQSKANEEFERRIKEKVEIRPEDRPQFWD